MRYVSVILFLIHPFLNCFGVEKSPGLNIKDQLKSSESIKEKINKIKDIEPENYFNVVDDYRSLIEKYIKNKKMVCMGDFSLMVLVDTGDPIENDKKKKLSKEERNLCLREVKGLQISYINNMHIARKKYLDYLHESRVKELVEARDLALKELLASYSTNTKKRKRSRR